jgi:Ca2+-binding EF-hand superfamily protein
MDRDSKGYITYEDYARHFKLLSNSNKHAKNVFETLDKKGKGKLTLEDFVRVSIPDMQSKDYEIVRKWMN